MTSITYAEGVNIAGRSGVGIERRLTGKASDGYPLSGWTRLCCANHSYIGVKEVGPMKSTTSSMADDIRHDDPRREIARLKVGLITKGVRIAPSASSRLHEAKPQLRARSGVSGGIELTLCDRIHVVSSARESFAKKSPYELSFEGGNYVLRSSAGRCLQVNIAPRPAFYSKFTSDGIPMVEVGQMCSRDRICIAMNRHCIFWKKQIRCAYCSIGANSGIEAPSKTPEQIAETVVAAAADTILPAKHVLLGGGTVNNHDRGALFAARVCEAIKRRLEISIYVMIVPPSNLSDIKHLKEAGADEIGMNLEFFSEKALKHFAPGKSARIGRDGYLSALEYAVQIFGPVNTRSILIVGIEPEEETLFGVRRLASMGVMPILSPFQALDGSLLAGTATGCVDRLIDLMEAAHDICADQGLILGPTCIACQNNTLTLPYGEDYYYY